MKGFIGALSCVFLLVLFPVSLEAGYLVYLKNGRVMYVDTYEAKGEWTVLNMEGGGKLKIKSDIIVSLAEGKIHETNILKKSESPMKVKASTEPLRASPRRGRLGDFDISDNYMGEEMTDMTEPSYYEEQEEDDEDSRRSMRVRREPSRRDRLRKRLLEKEQD